MKLFSGYGGSVAMNHIFALLVFILLFSGYVSAETPEEKGLAIAKEDDTRDNGFGDYRAELVMTLKNRQGGRKQPSYSQ